MKSLILCMLLLTITLSQTISCTTGQVYVKFTKKTASWASEESWEIYASGSKIYTSPVLENSVERDYEVCLAATTNNQYSIKMIDSFGDSWSAGAYLMVTGINGNRILKHVIMNSNFEEIPLSLYTPINKNDSWKMTAGSVTGTWTEYNFPDTTWNQVTLGSVSTTVTGTQYFRKTFAGLAGMAAYEASFNYREGIVAYINGVEIFRDNMLEGTPTGSTTASGSYPVLEYHSIIRPGAEVANGQSVLAIELHFITSGEKSVDFNSYLAIYAKSVTEDDLCFTYPYDIAVTATGGDNVGNMNDYSRATYYYVSSTYFPATVTYTLTGPKPYFNGYRVWPYTSPTAGASNYILQGTNSATGATWTNIVVANGLVYENQKFINTFGYFNAGLYSNYRVQFNQPASSTYIYVYEAYPLTCATAIPTSIEFEQTSYSFYARYQEVKVKPKVGEFTTCSINPPPASGLEFDSTTCTLSGKSNTASTTLYTVTSIMNGQTYTGTFTLQITDCAGSILAAVRTYSTSAAYEAFTIKDATTQNVIVQVAANSGQVNSVEWSTIVCVTGSKYIVEVSSSNYNYWQSTSFLYINAMLDGTDDYETIIRAKYDINLGLPTSYTFNAQYSIKPFESWNYKMGEVPANWYSSDTSGWATGTAGTFPASSNQIQLYKKTFSVTSLDNVAGLVVSFKYQYGYIIYLNNHEVARKGFTGDLSSSTYSSTSLSDCNFRQISLPIKTISDGTTTSVDYVTTGTNTIAIGLIAAGSAQTTANFDGAVRLMGAESSSRIWKTSYTSSSISGSPSTVMNFYYGTTMYYSTCTNNYYYLTFDDDRHEWISSVTFKLYYTQNTQQVRNVIIKAKNAEDSEWTTIKTIEGMTWSLAGQANKIWLNNNKAYNQYRFENFASGNTADCYWKFGMFDLRSDSTTINVPAFTYPASTSIFKDIEMGEIYSDSDYYTDYTVSPPFPTGVILDPYTGTISGTAHAVATAQTYTISAKKFNTGETVTAQMSLAVEVCTGGKSLITLVARSDSYPSESSWKLYQGKGMTGTVLQSVSVLPAASALSYGDFCLNHGIYTLELRDTLSDGWSNPAGYYLTVDVGEMKFEMGQVYTGTSPTSVTTMFSSFLPFQIEYDDWKVFKGAEIAENWNAVNFDDSTWTVTKAAQIGTNEAITTYIRREVTLDDVTNYQVLNIRVKYAGGVVAYFNGRRVARFNLEDGFDAESESIAIHDANTFSMFHIVLNTVGAVTGKNVMAFEIHRPYGLSSAEPVIFDATGVFGVNDCSVGVDSVINVSGTAGTTIGDLENFFDLTPVSYGYQPNSIGTYLQWSVENLEGTKFNSFALQTVYAYSSWGFSLYGREIESLDDDDPDAEEYLELFSDVELSTVARGRSAWDAPVGIAGFRQFKHEIDDAASSTIYISAYILQYCKASGTGSCPGIDDYPPVGEGQISPADCPKGFRGYSYRQCSGGTLGPVQNDKCIHRLPARIRYDNDRYTIVLNTETSIPAPRYQNIITKFYLAENTFLPEGLFIDETTGAISGKATEESGLKVYTIFGQNPSGVTSTTINISVRKGECKAEGNFPKTTVGEVATYECSVAGSYIGTQKRACILGVRDGEWQKIQGTCMPIFMIVFLVIIAIVVIAIVGLFVMRATKKTKAVGGVKGKKSGKSVKSTKAGASKKASIKAVKV